MSMSRRRFLRQTGAGGIGLLTFTIAGCQKEMTPAEARRANVSYQVLSTDEALAVDALGETLVPGSAVAGISHYIDHQLHAPVGECMLMIKYLGVPLPFTSFYQGGLAAAAAAAARRYGKPVWELAKTQANEFVSQMASGGLEAWEGPPAEFFYFVLRADAVDVRYGTMRGFDDLSIPYMAHIIPASPWGA